VAAEQLAGPELQFPRGAVPLGQAGRGALQADQLGPPALAVPFEPVGQGQARPVLVGQLPGGLEEFH
jgi:hypothetical protein